MRGTDKRKSAKSKSPAYLNPDLPAKKRVKDLLSRMTLAEKAAQMRCIWREKNETLVDADGNFDLKKAKSAFKQGPWPWSSGPAQ